MPPSVPQPREVTGRGALVDAQKYSNIRSLGDSSDSKHHDDNDDIELQPLKAQDSDNPDESDNSATENDEARTGLTDERRGSASTTLSFQLYTPDEEQAVVRKFDRRLVLFVALLYMLSFLDRSNIGNARVAGLNEDLGLSPNRFEWVLTSFYISYILFEWMSLLWKIVPAHIYVTIIVLSWGVIASLQALATSFASMIVLRVLLGIGEAGFTGIPYFLSFFYKKDELALRTGLFISAAPLATSFASSLAWVILKLGENGPIAPWRLLFLVEGFPSVIIAAIAFHIIPDGPAKASYLTARQRRIARLRLRNRAGEKATRGGSFKWREALQVLRDPKAYTMAFMFFLSNMAFSSMPVFLPTIIRTMGHSALTSQALSAPPYLVAFIAVIITAYASDRYRTRSAFLIFHALLSAAGYLLLALSGHLGLGNWWRYTAIYPACIGFFSVITLIITWNINNQMSESRQGAGFAVMQLIGQCGPLVGTRLYPDSDAPLYTSGMAWCTAAMVSVAVLALVMRLALVRANERRKAGQGLYML